MREWLKTQFNSASIPNDFARTQQERDITIFRELLKKKMTEYLPNHNAKPENEYWAAVVGTLNELWLEFSDDIDLLSEIVEAKDGEKP
jgi:hypothetical protein